MGAKTSLELTPQEIAFSNQLIRTEILRLSMKSDLLECRLVCHSWNEVASAHLRNRPRLGLYFYDQFLQSGSKYLPEFPSILQRTKDDEIPFLANTLGLYVNSINVRPWWRFWNKCDSFVSDRILEKVFFSPRLQLTNLTLTIRGLNVSETEAVDKICKLITSQADHLKSLTLSVPFQCPRKFMRNLNPPNSNQSFLQARDAEFKKILSKYNFPNKRMTKLRKLELDASENILEILIELCPNLTDIQTKLENLVEPWDRLGFLKKISLFITCKEAIRKLESVLMMSSDSGVNLNLRLRVAYIHFGRIHTLRNGTTGLETKIRALNLFSKILECSANSLEIVVWTTFEWVDKLEVDWPDVMPRMIQFEFVIPTYLGGRNVFPMKREMTSVFPNLRQVCIYPIKNEALLGEYLEGINSNPFQEVELFRLRGYIGKKVIKYRMKNPEELKEIQTIFPTRRLLD